MLARLAAVLQLDIADLVDSDQGGTPERVSLEPSGEDAVAALAALASYGAMHPGQLTHLFGWTVDRLSAAVNHIHQQLEPTALRLIVTDLRLTLTVRPDALFGLTRQHLNRARLLQRPLSYVDAGEMLNLVKKKLLEPFPDQSDGASGDSAGTVNLTWLVDTEWRFRSPSPASPARPRGYRSIPTSCSPCD
jgi:hypothetical protein